MTRLARPPLPHPKDPFCGVSGFHRAGTGRVCRHPAPPSGILTELSPTRNRCKIGLQNSALVAPTSAVQYFLLGKNCRPTVGQAPAHIADAGNAPSTEASSRLLPRQILLYVDGTPRVRSTFGCGVRAATAAAGKSGAVSAVAADQERSHPRPLLHRRRCALVTMIGRVHHLLLLVVGQSRNHAVVTRPAMNLLSGS